MPGPAANPMSTKENWQKLHDAQAAITRALEGATVLEQCGVECQQQRALAQSLQAQLDKTRAAFFPNGPPRR